MVFKRGALIVIEGVDRTGKTTQCRNLVEGLKNKDVAAMYSNFPDRTSEIGKVINHYLTRKTEMSDETIHLLFSANRWEKCGEIIKQLETGTTLIIDRYCYSGVAFSGAKGLDINWCKNSDVGLPKPDKVFFLNMPLETAMQRNGFGNERYEVKNFQKKVLDVYMQLKDEKWDILDANRPMDIIQEELLQKTLEVVKNVSNEPLDKMWIYK
ncbi:uncharacterized protein LOC133318846 [Danaus plexippus]|uniref:uncharacterized protein LOC133318846 n=1 Tax=Danaus plexippus TaxID=13037 RepID=UPI002AAF46DD|nr:uncharacterized protein LOC133318846 [Danaus plexippus]